MHQRQPHKHAEERGAAHPHVASVAARLRATHARDWRVLASRAYHVALWLFLALLLAVQPLGFVWGRRNTTIRVLYGRSPLEGRFTVSGSTNDEPFTDRAVVCSLVGRRYKPAQLSELLANATTANATAEAPLVHGYRVIARAGHALAPEARAFYATTCDQIAATLDGLRAACAGLGYDVARIEFLRVVATGGNGADADASVVALPTTLPVLILPYYDSARSARYVIPGADGHACVFRLAGKYVDATQPRALLSGVDRAAREALAAEWLALPRGGVWRHGWLEDPDSATARWYADVYTTQSPGAFGLRRRQFDTTGTVIESDCASDPGDCRAAPSKLYWGKDLFLTAQNLWATSVTILDERRHGFFLYEGDNQYQTASTYRLESVIANVSVTLLLFRWLVALVATQRAGTSIGLGGALSCARAFHVLPIVLLSRLKTILAAFWTAGCVFEGDQRTLSEAWFVMYPALAEFALLLVSLLNLAAKLLRRRASDALFGPTVLLLCLLHRVRAPIADSGLFEMSGRVATRVSSSRFDALRLVDLVSPAVGFQLNGAVRSVFAVKLALLALNLVPLVVGAHNTSVRSRVRAGIVRCEAERALALRVACSGGLGRSAVYDVSGTPQEATATSRVVRSNRHLDAIVPMPLSATSCGSNLSSAAARPTGTLLPYELARAGYVVLGRDALVSMKDWFWFMASAPCRALGIPMRHLRMVTFTLADEGASARGGLSVSECPTMCRVTDERFRGVGAWDISVRPLR